MRKTKIGWRLLLVAVGIILLGMTGCMGEKEISFRHVALSGRKVEGIQVVEDSSSFDQLWEGLFAPGEKPEIDWDSEAVIGVFLGEKPTGGYSVIVRKIVRKASDHLEVIVDQRQPGPTDIVTMAITYPGHLVAVDREQLPKGKSWRVTVVDAQEEVLFDSEQSRDALNEGIR